MEPRKKWLLCLILNLFSFVIGKIHHLNLQEDARASIELSHFGFTKQGTFDVRISNFTADFQPGSEEQGRTALDVVANYTIGFTFSKGDEVPEFVRTTPGDCLLWKRHDRLQMRKNTVYFLLDLKSKTLKIERHGSDLMTLEVCRTSACKDEVTQLTKEDSFVKPQVSMFSKEDTVRKRAVTEAASQGSAAKKPVDSKELKNVFGKEMKTGNVTAITSSSKGKFVTVLPKITTAKTISISAKTEPKSVPTAESEIKDVTKISQVAENGIVEGKGTDFEAPRAAVPISYDGRSYSTQFGVRIWTNQEEGLYYFIYHNCKNYNTYFHKRILVSFDLEVKEKNAHSFLSAGEILKPPLYFGLSVLFFATGIVWIHMLRSSKDNEVFRIHHLMSALVFIKSLSLFFHGVNYYFVSLHGRQQEVWAVVFYIMHLLKGALLFGVIILIGTGYTFFKNFLTERDRKLFMIIIPLQVLDNVALVILAEEEEGERNYRFWMQLFIFIDLICCLAIILPVIWSIRHLQEASRTDGKAAFNLKKLRLFRHFYILIICYVYLTRIIKYLVVFTVPFKYTWLVVVVEEVGTWLFFVITGYKFKPAPNNPYLKLSQSDDELEMDEAVTQSGVLEGVTHLKRGQQQNDTRHQSFDTSLGSPEGEELLGEDVVFSQEDYSGQQRSGGPVSGRSGGEQSRMALVPIFIDFFRY